MSDPIQNTNPKVFSTSLPDPAADPSQATPYQDPFSKATSDQAFTTTPSSILNTTSQGDSLPKARPDPGNTNTPPPPPETVVTTAPHAPKKYGGKKVIATIFGVLLLIGGVAAGVLLVQRQQLLEQQAASGRECQESPNCILLEDPDDSGSYTAPQDIEVIKITAKDTQEFTPQNLTSLCYQVGFDGRKFSWQKIGTGSDCKDISNIQVWMKQTQEKGIEWLIDNLCDGIKVKLDKDHGTFDLVVEISLDKGATWQPLQSFKGEGGSAKEYFFKYDKPLAEDVKLRAKIIYNGQEVASVTKDDLECKDGKKPTPTPPKSTDVSCPLTPKQGRTIVILNPSKDNQIRSDKTEANSRFGPVSTNISPGIYKVTLVSYDNHSQLTPPQSQPREQWYLEMGSSGNTGTIKDLPEDQDWLEEVVNESFNVNSLISSVTARHAAYPDKTSPNSISPVCAAFDKKDTPPPPVSAQCHDIKAYNTKWELLSQQQLSALKPGSKVRFAVLGTASSGSIDKARFKINGGQRPEVTTKKPGGNEFYDEYTIPDGTTTFSVSAQVHHSELGWF